VSATKKGPLFWRVVGSVFAVIWMVNAFQMFACPAISFGGSSRAVVWECLPVGGVPGAVAGLGIILTATVLLYWLWQPFVASKQRRSPTANGSERLSSSSQEPRTLPPTESTLRSTTDPVVLRNAASTSDFSSRVAIAANPHTPVDVLTSLSMDKASGVRRNIVSNPNTPIEVLEQMAEYDNFSSVMSAAREQLSTRTPDTFKEHDEASTGDQILAATELLPLGNGGAETSTPSDILDALERLADLHERGALSEPEFAELKRRLINS
jgi:Short C-terminal domain